MNNICTLGGGCYWCLDAVYSRINGVSKVRSGYSGGHRSNPSADEVYRGDTGHAEVVQFEYNPGIITYRKLLEIFFVMHDPTTLNRQGNDVGDWYRSIIFYHDEQQKQDALTVRIQFAAKLWNNPVVTKIEKFDYFWPAEDSMQDFYNKNPAHAYCQAVINPKISKLKTKFADELIRN